MSNHGRACRGPRSTNDTYQEMKILIAALVALTIIQVGLSKQRFTQVVLSTNHYSFTSEGNHVSRYYLLCRATCQGTNPRVSISELVAALKHPQQNAAAGFSQIVTQKWLDATAEAAYQRQLRIFRDANQPSELHDRFMAIYRNRTTVLDLLAKAYQTQSPNEEEYFQITGTFSKGPVTSFASQKTLLPFLLPFRIMVNGQVRVSYDPQLSRDAASALSPIDPVKRLLEGEGWQGFVGSLVYEQARAQ